MKRYVAGLLLMVPIIAQAHWDSAYYHESAMPGTTVKADWMKDLLDMQSILQVSIPGTHDSGARFGNDYVIAQTMDIPTQLRAGIRFLDIRLKATNGSLAVHHGAYYQKQMFGDVLSQVRNYLKQHPSEFVVMRVKEEVGEDSQFARLVQNYVNSPLYSDVIWRTGSGGPFAAPRVGDVRAKVVILRQSFDGKYGLDYNVLTSEDHWTVSTNWDLYGKWQRNKAFLQRASQLNSHGMINYLSGSNIAFPYFVASGHVSSGTSAARLATGLTTPGWSWKWPDFPRVNCFIGICTIAFEGTNVLSRQLIEKINASKGTGVDAAGGELSEFGYLSNSAYVGIVVGDFPGPGLIEAVVAANRFYSPGVCNSLVGCVEYSCDEEFTSPRRDYRETGTVKYRARPVAGTDFPQVSVFNKGNQTWTVMGPFKDGAKDGFDAEGREYYKRPRPLGQVEIYFRRTEAKAACFVDNGADTVWEYDGILRVADPVTGLQPAANSVPAQTGSIVQVPAAAVSAMPAKLQVQRPVAAGAENILIQSGTATAAEGGFSVAAAARKLTPAPEASIAVLNDAPPLFSVRTSAPGLSSGWSAFTLRVEPVLLR